MSARPPAGGGRREARAGQLGAIEARMIEEIGELTAIGRVVGGRLSLPGRGLDLWLEQAHRRLRLVFRSDVADRRLGLGGHEEADRRLRLLGEMSDQAGDAGEDRHAARQHDRRADVAQRRGDRHRHVHRQRLAPDSRRDCREPRRGVDAAPGDLALARQRDHPLGARIDRLMQRMAEAGERAAGRAPLARRRFRRFVGRRAGVDARQHVVDQRAGFAGRTEDDCAAAEHAGGDRALQRGGISGVGHARRLHARRQTMLGQRHQREIEKEALVGRRHDAGRQQKEIVGETRRAHQFAGEVVSAHGDVVGLRGGDRGRRRAALADQHGLLLVAAASRRCGRAGQRSSCRRSRKIVGQYQSRGARQAVLGDRSLRRCGLASWCRGRRRA